MHMHTHSNSAKGAYTCTDRRMQNVFTIERNCRYAHAPHNVYAAGRRDTYIGWVHCGSDNSTPCNYRPVWSFTRPPQKVKCNTRHRLRCYGCLLGTHAPMMHQGILSIQRAAVRLACAARVCEWARHWTSTGRCRAGRVHVQD